MNDDGTLRLFVDAFAALGYVAGPLLAAALVAGVLVGLAQTVAQVNEASISFLAKVLAIVAVLAAFGAAMSGQMIGFERRCLRAIEHVVR